MNGFAPPLADVGDVIGVIVFVLFLLVSVVGQLMAKLQEAQRQAAKRVRAPQPRVPPAKGGVLEDEIGEFLQRTAQRRVPERGSPPAASIERRTLGPPLSSPVGPAAATPGAEPVLQAELLTQRAEVADHVRTYLSGGRFDRETTDLGSQVAQADEKMEEHLRQAFEHRLGRLGTMAGATASVQPAAAPETAPAAPADVAAQWAAMLRTPASIRQAVVLSEVLNRPLHRWS